ncbi:MAG TPA: hypothetical protein VF331_28300 [Polyangiales bacterium]
MFAVLGLSGCSAYDSKLLGLKGDAGHGFDAGWHLVIDAGAPDASPRYDAALAVECSKDPEFATCTRPHANTSCVNGTCFLVSCAMPYVDCDNNPDNGCEARLDSPEHCGLCGAACHLAHGQPACVAGHCALAHCDRGFGDCDGNADNGCETALDNATNCGSCGTTCTAQDNATAGCTGGVCGVGACVGAFGDCDMLAANGCEQPLNTNTHCQSCGQTCAPANASGKCDSGQCVIDTCTGKFVDCNGLVADGCEATLDSLAHCGSCSAQCTLANVARPLCDTTAASAVCAIDHTCATTDPSCHDGALENGCSAGFGDCDSKPNNGCETDLSRLSTCGSCSTSCVLPNTVTQCSSGKCVLVGCVPGFDQCIAGEACRSLAIDAANCGQCGKPCGAGTSQCAGGRCTSQVCATGKADCDGISSNGCETDLSSAGNCGFCGHACGPFAHATAACKTGACAIGQCDSGYADCDGDASNGCEVNVHTLGDCGGCGKSCSVPNGQPSCATGVCTLSMCDPGRADCNASLADGCETDLTLPDHCGSCGNDCRALPYILSSGCAAGACQYVCQTGRADCDHKAANGCEVDLTSNRNCGACGNDCGNLPHVNSAACSAGVCKNLVCAAGWADCDGDPQNGCERSLRTLNDCGSCNAACAPAHASATCFTGQCVLTACDSGFDNCNGNATDGCEAALSAPTHCGSCANQCIGSSTCANGQCTCTQNSDCKSGLSCCSGACTDTGGICFPFLCLPGTARTNNANCGGCGQLCILFCCTG